MHRYPSGREHPNGRLGNAATTLVSFDPKRESDTLRVSVHPEMDGPERAFNPSSKNHRKGGHERRHDPSEWTCARRQSTCMRIPFLPYRALSECRSSPRRKWFQPTHGRAWRRGDEDQRTRLIEEHARPIDPRLHAKQMWAVRIPFQPIDQMRIADQTKEEGRHRVGMSTKEGGPAPGASLPIGA